MRTEFVDLLLPQENWKNASINLTEWVDYTWVEEITFMIDVQQTTGSPSAGTLTAKFQKRMPYVSGPYQWINQRLSDYTAAEKAAYIVEGDWPATLADYTLAAPITHSRTVRNFGMGVNLVLTGAALAGGTSPGFQVVVTAIVKGR